mmetsp:Transcript_36156/g.113493  ORF Transcript_36156/g.113493 Transcript_36156/m.113493 type:complete len:310 (+) Transcript_36156:184-1113(+)
MDEEFEALRERTSSEPVTRAAQRAALARAAASGPVEANQGLPAEDTVSDLKERTNTESQTNASHGRTVTDDTSMAGSIGDITHVEDVNVVCEAWGTFQNKYKKLKRALHLSLSTQSVLVAEIRTLKETVIETATQLQVALNTKHSDDITILGLRREAQRNLQDAQRSKRREAAAQEALHTVQAEVKELRRLLAVVKQAQDATIHRAHEKMEEAEHERAMMVRMHEFQMLDQGMEVEDENSEVETFSQWKVRNNVWTPTTPTPTQSGGIKDKVRRTNSALGSTRSSAGSTLGSPAGSVRSGASGFPSITR